MRPYATAKVACRNGNSGTVWAFLDNGFSTRYTVYHTHPITGLVLTQTLLYNCW